MEPDDRAYVVDLAAEVFGSAVRGHRWPFLVDEEGAPLEADAFWPDHGVAMAIVGYDAGRWHYAPFALNLRGVRLLLVPVGVLPTGRDGRLVRDARRVRQALLRQGFPRSRAAFDELTGETDGERAAGPIGGPAPTWSTGPVGGGTGWEGYVVGGGDGPDDEGGPEGGRGVRGDEGGAGGGDGVDRGDRGARSDGGADRGDDGAWSDRGADGGRGAWDEEGGEWTAEGRPDGGSWADGPWYGDASVGRWAAAEEADAEPWLPDWRYEEHEDPWGDDGPDEPEPYPEDDAVLELGWRSRPIALAALGAAVLSRRALGVDALGETDATALQVLVALAVPDDEDAPFERANARGLALRLALGERVLRAVLDELIAEDHVRRTDDPVDAGFELAPAGRDVVQVWLARIAPLFAGWPAAAPGVDDAG
ncbi:hypothetical protein AB0L40_24370 [Patulibacter sp. NPDC049589]|uniref:hypothetical protein n=1 Tax=Patulibacter sp. NPDC049589 TaxID=3154731 RepID=UPI003422B56C